jgi:hypothetical protein
VAAAGLEIFALLGVRDVKWWAVGAVFTPGTNQILVHSDLRQIATPTAHN